MVKLQSTNNIFSLYDIFKSFEYIPVSITSLDKRSNVTYYSYHFVTMQLPCFNE